MIAHYNIQQGSLEWHEIKWGKIGGTLSAGLFVDSDTLFIDILSQLNEDFEPTDSFTNYDMERGNELEPFAREYLEKYTGLSFNECGWLQSEENKLLGISVDGITEDETASCEIKCLSRKEHMKILLKNDIPKEKLFQCIHYFTVNPKLKEHYFIAFRPEAKKHFIKKLKRESLVDIGLKEEFEIKQYGVKGQEIKPKIEKRTKLVTIDEASKMALEHASRLLTKIEAFTFDEF